MRFFSSPKRSHIPPIGSHANVYLVLENEKEADGSPNLAYTLRIVRYLKSEIDRFRYTVAVRDDYSSGAVWNYCIAHLRNVLSYTQTTLDFPHLAKHHSRFVPLFCRIPPTLDKHLCRTFYDKKELSEAFDDIESLTSSFEQILITLDNGDNLVSSSRRFSSLPLPIIYRPPSSPPASPSLGRSTNSPDSHVDPYMSPLTPSPQQQKPIRKAYSFFNLSSVAFPTTLTPKSPVIDNEKITQQFQSPNGPREKKRAARPPCPEPLSFDDLLQQYEASRLLPSREQCKKGSLLAITYQGKMISRPRKLVRQSSTAPPDNPTEKCKLCSPKPRNGRWRNYRLEKQRDHILHMWTTVAGY